MSGEKSFVHGGRTLAYASFGRRLAAALLDSAFWVIGIAFFFPGFLFEDSEAGAAIAALLLLTAWFNYFAVCEWRFGQTVGKNMLGLRVMAVDGGRLSWNAAALRNLLRLADLPLALVGIDYAIVNRSPRRQRLGDRAADTLVVREPAPEPAPPALPGAVTAAGPTAAELFTDATAALGGVSPSEPGEEGLADPRGKTVLSEGSGQPLPPPEVQEQQAHRGPWPPATWTSGIAILGVLGALVAGIFLSVFGFAIDSDAGSEEGSSLSNIVLQLGTVLGFLIVPVAIAASRPAGASAREVAERLGVRRFAPSAFGWMAAAYGGYIAAAAVYVAIVGTPEQDDIADLFGSLPAKILLIVVGASIAEEVCFRGFLFGGLRTGMGATAAAIVSAVIWGALHAVTGITAVPVLIFFGIALALLYEKTGSIVPGIILHAINNALALLTL